MGGKNAGWGALLVTYRLPRRIRTGLWGRLAGGAPISLQSEEPIEGLGSRHTISNAATVTIDGLGNPTFAS
jgi:hypothetical protein